MAGGRGSRRRCCCDRLPKKEKFKKIAIGGGDRGAISKAYLIGGLARFVDMAGAGAGGFGAELAAVAPDPPV